MIERPTAAEAVRPKNLRRDKLFFKGSRNGLRSFILPPPSSELCSNRLSPIDPTIIPAHCATKRRRSITPPMKPLLGYDLKTFETTILRHPEARIPNKQFDFS